MDRLVTRRRRGPSTAVYLLFLVGLVAIGGGVLYPAGMLLGSSSAGSLVTADAGVDPAPFLLGGIAVALGSVAVVLAEFLFVARR